MPAKPVSPFKLPSGLFDDHVILAVLHKLTVEEFDRNALARELDAAAKRYGGMFAPFTMVQHHQYSRAVNEILGNMLIGGSITYYGADLKDRRTPSVRGRYGAANFGKFKPHQQKVLEEIAARVSAASVKQPQQSTEHAQPVAVPA